jgi:hypothetical protein
MNMLHWLHTLLPHIPHYGYVLVFVVVFLNNIGFPLPGETILLGAGFILGRTADSLREPTVAAPRLPMPCGVSIGTITTHDRSPRAHCEALIKPPALTSFAVAPVKSWHR